MLQFITGWNSVTFLNMSNLKHPLNFPFMFQQEKIENLLETKRRSGRDLKHTIQRKKNFRNPRYHNDLL
jgi:hypothetical protein